MSTFDSLIISLLVLTTLLFGGGLLWSAKYLALRGAPAAGMKTVGWTALSIGLLLAGASLLHVGMLPVGIVAMTAAAVSLALYRRSQKHMLLWSIGCAARHRMPIADMLRSLSDEHGPRCQLVADRLEQGHALAPLLINAFRIRAVDDAVGLSVGSRYGRFDALADVFTPEHQQTRMAFDRITIATLYALFVCSALAAVTTYFIIQVLPEFVTAMNVLGEGVPQTEAPWPTRVWLEHSAEFYRFRFVFVAVLLLGVVSSLVVLAQFAGWLPANAPWLQRMGQPLDRACILRSLAVAVEAQQELPAALRYMASVFPKTYWMSRLQAAADNIDRGQDWIKSLQQAKIVSRGDAVLLTSAQRAGNLTWALRELASTRRRRYAYRCQIIFQIAISFGLVLLGLAIMFTATAVFIPLINLLQGAAR